MNYIVKMQSVATQAGSFNTRGIGGYVLDVLEKCYDMHGLLSKCGDNIQKSQARLDTSESKVQTMGATVSTLASKVDSIGAQLIQNRATLDQRRLAIEGLKSEIASKQCRLEEIQKEHDAQQTRPRESALQELRHQRATLEQHLQKINRDIDVVYEDVFDTEQKLIATRDGRMKMREDETEDIRKLTDRHAHAHIDRKKLLSLTDGAELMNLRDFYVKADDVRRIEADIEEMKHRQFLVNKHIQEQRAEREFLRQTDNEQFLVDKHIHEQREEREFLRQTANEILAKVHEVERKVRKTRGYSGWVAQSVPEPNWQLTEGAPNMWVQSPTFTREQLKHMIKDYKRNCGHAYDADNVDVDEEVSDFATEEEVRIELLEGGRN